MGRPEVPVSVRTRALTMSDAPAITRLLEGETQLALQTASIPIPYTLESVRAFLETADSEDVFAIMQSDEFVGMIGMFPGVEPVEIGYWVGRVHWGREYATRALELLVLQAETRGVGALLAHVFPRNQASLRVPEKNGFSRVGEIEKDLPQRGGLRRLICFHRKI